jgi:hypothetical protein
MKRKANEAGIHVVGYVESELARIVESNNALGTTHAERVIAEALLILLKRSALPQPASNKP